MKSKTVWWPNLNDPDPDPLILQQNVYPCTLQHFFRVPQISAHALILIILTEAKKCYEKRTRQFLSFDIPCLIFRYSISELFDGLITGQRADYVTIT